MKIEMHPKLNVYRKQDADKAAPKAEKASVTAKKDISDFSHGATVTDKAMVGTKAAIQSYLTAPASEDRLEALRQGIKDGTYRVETYEIVDAILGFERTV